MPPKAAAGGPEPEWKRLQRKVFTRWINMKLRLGRSPVAVKESELATIWGKSGYELVELLQVLSKQKYEGRAFKIPTPEHPLSKIHVIDQVNRALTFGWKAGVKAELKPSAENLESGEEVLCMGYIWAIMRSFLKFGEDDDRLSAEKALLMWVKNQTAEYADVKVNGFGKDWHNGKAFCALIHKYRPDLIGEWPPKGTDEENIKLAMNAAEEWFKLEQYLEPSEIAVLDEKSMIIYVSEYYYGITGFAKVFQAGKRIKDLIDYTQTNDQLRDAYSKKARELRDSLADATKDLDIHVDDTLAGAIHNLKKFQTFKDTKKARLNNDYLECENLMNTLSTNLAANNRPAYKAEPGCALEDLRSGLDGVEQQFQDLNNKLYKELEKQQRLAKLNDQHGRRYTELMKWIALKLSYLEEDFRAATTSQMAKQSGNTFKAFQQESTAVQATLGEWHALGSELAANKFEFQDKVNQRETEVNEQFDVLNKKAKQVEAVVDDHLKMLLKKEAILADVFTHNTRADAAAQFLTSMRTRLEKPSVNDVPEAQSALDSLEISQYELDDYKTTFAALSALGKKIADAHYSGLTEYRYEHADAIVAQDEALQSEYNVLVGTAKELRLQLEDELAREKVKAQVASLQRQFALRVDRLEQWLCTVHSALEEVNITSIQQAEQQQRAVDNVEFDVNDHDDNVAAMHALGERIKTSKYRGRGGADWDLPAVEAETVTKRQEEIATAVATVRSSIDARKAQLAAALQKQQELDDLRLMYAAAAIDFSQWAAQATADALLEDLNDLSFEDLTERNVPAEIDAVRSTLAAKKTRHDEAWTALQTAGVLDNSYTSLTPEAVEVAAASLTQALNSRFARLNEQLAVKQHIDNLCKQFSDVANPFSKMIDSKREYFTKNVASLEEQLADVEQTLASLGEYEPTLLKIREADQALKNEGIVNNVHSLTSGDEIMLMWQSYKDFLQAKASNLRGQIESAKNRGITAAQLAEYERNFAQFDTDGTKTLSAEEFKQCLYSLGENKSRDEVAALMKQYGNDEKIDFDGFLAYMRQVQGNNNTKEALQESVNLIGPGQAAPRKLEECKHIFSPEQLEYLANNVPVKANGDIDFAAWVDESFKR